jgi:hypothetical protein
LKQPHLGCAEDSLVPEALIPEATPEEALCRNILHMLGGSMQDLVSVQRQMASLLQWLTAKHYWQKTDMVKVNTTWLQCSGLKASM